MNVSCQIRAKNYRLPISSVLSRTVKYEAQIYLYNTRGGRRRNVHCRAVSPAPDGPLEWLLEGLARHADPEPGVLEGHVQGSLERLVRFPVARHDNNTINGRTYVYPRRRETAALIQGWPKGEVEARDKHKRARRGGRGEIDSRKEVNFALTEAK